MVSVAQLVEPRIVVPVVVGSSPIAHPIPEDGGQRTDDSSRIALTHNRFLFGHLVVINLK
jgi:hypothetical protein